MAIQDFETRCVQVRVTGAKNRTHPLWLCGLQIFHFAAGMAALGVAFATNAAAAPVRVDLNINQSRSDILTREWENWSVPDGSARVERAFGTIKAKLTAANGGALEGVW